MQCNTILYKFKIKLNPVMCLFYRNNEKLSSKKAILWTILKTIKHMWL